MSGDICVFCVHADRQALGAGVFYDSWRRKTHPHVWILNTPVVLWYIADKIWCATRSRYEGKQTGRATVAAVVRPAPKPLLLTWGSSAPYAVANIFCVRCRMFHYCVRLLYRGTVVSANIACDRRGCIA